MRTLKTLASAVFLFSVLIASRLTAATAGYAVVDVSSAYKTANSGTALVTVGTSGTAAGVYLDSSQVVHGFVRSSSGTVTTLDAAASSAGIKFKAIIPIAFNASDTLVGVYVDTSGVYHGLLRSSSGMLTKFSVSAASTGEGNGTIPTAINDAGQVAGTYTDSDSKPHGFIRSASGTITSYDVSGTIAGTVGLGLNSKGVIAGTYVDSSNVPHGYIRSATGAITAVTVPAAGTSEGQGTVVTTIDAAGDVAGIYVDSSNVAHGFVRSAAGVITTFSASSAGSGTYQGTFPYAFDTAGDLAGFLIDSSNVVRGFVRSASGTLTQFTAPGAVASASASSALGHLLAHRGGSSATHGLLARTNRMFTVMGAQSVAANSIPTSGGIFNVKNGPYIGTIGLNMDPAGDVTGAFVDGDIVLHSFIRRSDGTLTVINATKAGTGFLQGTVAVSANASGVVVGTYADANSILHGFVLTLSQTATTAKLTASPTSTLFGESVTLTAKVAAGTATPTNGATVHFMDGAKQLGTATLASGTATLTTTALSGGSHSITAIYPGDPSYKGSTSSAAAVTISKATSTTTLSPSATSATYGTSLKLKATVKALYGGTPTGTVTFKSGTTTLGTATLSSAVATLTTAALAVGTDSLTAVYAGDTDLSTSTSAAVKVAVTQATPALTWATPSAIAAGTALSGLQLNATAPVAGKFVYSPAAGVTPAAGTQTLSVTFTPADTASYKTATATVKLTVNSTAATAPTVTVTPGSTTPTTLQALRVTVAVAGSPTATGTVALSGGGYSGTATLSGGGAIFEIPAGGLTTGSVTLTAAYTPDAAGVAHYKASSGTAKITVSSGTATSGATVALAATSGTAAVSSVASGTVVTLTATVTSGTTAVPRGTVYLCDAAAAFCTDIHRLGTAQLTSAGKAVFHLRPGVGKHSYEAMFTGTSSYKTGTSAAVGLTVTGSAVTTTSGVIATGSVGSYALSATVGNQGSASPTGTVKFVDTTYGNAVLGTATLTASSANAGLVHGASVTATEIIETSTSGDFNGDGYPDLALVTEDNTLIIELGSSSGSYTAKTAVDLGLDSSDYWPSAVLAGDFNGDGKQDLAILINGEAYSLIVLLGKGDGTFTRVSSSSTFTYSARTMAAGDFNKDGYLDLAVSGPSLSGVTLLKGKGDGTFTASTISLTGSTMPYDLTAGDFNGDGYLDLALLSNNSSGTVVILLGKGTGAFTQVSSTVSSGSYPVKILPVDINSDGNLDLAVVVPSSYAVAVLKGKGDGTFTTSTVSSTYYGIDMAVGDFNGDGVADLAVALQSQYNSSTGTEQPGSIAILAGNGVGGFSSNLLTVGEVLYSGSLLPAGLNADGSTDLVLCGIGQDNVSLIQPFLGQTHVSKASVSGIAVSGTGPHQVAAVYTGNSTYSSSQSATADLYAKAPTPTFSLAAGSYSGTQTVTISDTASDAVIRYTTDGSTPDEYATRYMGPVAISSTTTLKAVAYSDAYGTSATATATYTIK